MSAASGAATAATVTTDPSTSATAGDATTIAHTLAKRGEGEDDVAPVAASPGRGEAGSSTCAEGLLADHGRSRLVLHVDVNSTILISDPAAKRTALVNLNREIAKAAFVKVLRLHQDWLPAHSVHHLPFRSH